MPSPDTDLDIPRIERIDAIARLHWFDRIDSTNNAAVDRAAESSGETELFLTDNQQAGRGRTGNEWWSPDGALTFSLLMRKPALLAQDVPRISLAVGLAISRAMESYLPSTPIHVKWPNDVFADHRKVCGILIELPVSAPDRLVIGVGVNVNNVVAGAPEELSTTATSMLDALGRTIDQPLDRTDVLISCIQQIVAALTEVVVDPNAVQAALRKRCLLTGRRVRIALATREFSGLCQGIADDGALLVATTEGEERCYGGVVAEFA